MNESVKGDPSERVKGDPSESIKNNEMHGVGVSLATYYTTK